MVNLPPSITTICTSKNDEIDGFIFNLPNLTSLNEKLLSESEKIASFGNSEKVRDEIANITDEYLEELTALKNLEYRKSQTDRRIYFNFGSMEEKL